MDGLADAIRESCEAMGKAINGAVSGKTGRIKNRLRSKAFALRQKAERLESLAASLPEVAHSQAAEALDELLDEADPD